MYLQHTTFFYGYIAILLYTTTFFLSLTTLSIHYTTKEAERKEENKVGDLFQNVCVQCGGARKTSRRNNLLEKW
jgi:hypothetical protein